MDNKQIIITENHSDIVESQVQKIKGFLAELGLPSDNIIATNKERAIINQTLPGYISQLPTDLKKMHDTYLNSLLELDSDYLIMH